MAQRKKRRAPPADLPGRGREAAWTEAWLDGVARGESTMSQRKRSSIEARGGGLDAVRAAAREREVHLVLLTDDKGDELVAASLHPFSVLC